MAGYLPKPVLSILNRSLPISKGISLALTFDSQNPTTLYDASGKGHVGAIYSGTPESIDTSYGRGIQFDGSTDSYTIGNSTDYSLGVSGVDEPFSIDILYKTGTVSGGNQSYISKDSVSTREWLFQSRSTGDIFFFLFNNSNNNRIDITTATGVLSDNTLYKITFTYSGSGASSGMKMYLNAVDLPVTYNDNAGYTGTGNKAQDVIIGKLDNNSNHINGVMLGVTFWKGRELSQADVSSLYYDPFLMYRPSQPLPFLGAGGAPSTGNPYYYYLQQQLLAG